MFPIVSLLAVLSAALGAAPADVLQEQPKADERLAARVDPRVELMSIIARMAGFREYNQPNSSSPYAEQVSKHFGAFRDHEVIDVIRKLRRTRGISYDAVMSMAVHMTDTTELGEKVPFDQNPPRLDQRWRTAEARAFLEQARDFVKASDFATFIKEHEDYYEQAAASLRDALAKRGFIDWFDAFFGPRRAAEFYVIVGLLNGGGNYGVGLRFPDGREEITPVIGAYQFDRAGVPVFSDAIASTVVHEFCHSYTNVFVDRFADKLRNPGEKLYAHVAERMRSQAYGGWKTMMYESLVRACVIRYRHAADGPAAARKAIEHSHGRGFLWIEELADVLSEYEQNRGRYRDFEQFMPRVVQFFETYAANFEEQIAKMPKLVSIVPANGDADVDPALAAITITFDRPMSDGSWSLCGGGADFPEVAGEIHYDRQREVLTVPVKLKAGWNYRFSLNCQRAQNFRSREGIPLEPIRIEFSTRSQ